MEQLILKLIEQLGVVGTLAALGYYAHKEILKAHQERYTSLKEDGQELKKIIKDSTESKQALV